MKELISGLLDYGSLGKSAEIKEIDCNKIVKTVYEDLNFLITSTNTKIEVGELPILLGYETEIRLLFQNLIANAIKFKKPNLDPDIIISAEKNNSLWNFKVKDNGIGIDPDYKEKIFNIFQRLHRSDEFEGTGIGLAHCRKIVELHNGEIGVVSQLGEGSTFHFSINTNLELI